MTADLPISEMISMAKAGDLADTRGRIDEMSSAITTTPYPVLTRQPYYKYYQINRINST